MPIVIGLNHRSAPAEIRERLAVPSDGLAEALDRLKKDVPAEEAVLLSTCNRFEIYLRTKNRAATQTALRDHLKRRQGGRWMSEQWYEFDSDETVRHLFRVASGLDSMVQGEHEILGQVKQAYQTAHSGGFTGKLLNVLFQRSLFVGKRVRTETGLAIGSESVPSVAVGLAQRIFGSLEERRVLVLGAGPMAELAVKHFQSQKVRSVSITNRTFENAVAVARNCGGSALTWDEGLRQLDHSDIVLGSVGAPEPVIRENHVRAAMANRRGRSLFFIDIAMPRCIDPAANALDNVYLFNLDDLQKIVEENRSRRASEILKAESLIDQQTRAFAQWLRAHRSGQWAGMKHGASRPAGE
jgi:glutamyl-tRNA reductase